MIIQKKNWRTKKKQIEVLKALKTITQKLTNKDEIPEYTLTEKTKWN